MTQITLKGLHPDTDYAVQLRVHDGERVSGWSRKFPLHTITNSKKPKVPENVIWVPSDDSFIGEWDIVTENESEKPSNVVRYEVELRTPTLVSKFVSVPQITSGTRVMYELTKAKNTSLFTTAQTELSFRVRAVNHKDIKSDWTAWLTADQSAPDIPTNFVATGITEGIDLTWDLDATTKTKKYELHVGLTAGFTPTAANMIFSGYADKAAYYTGTYQVHYFKLFAVSAFGLKSQPALAEAEPISPYGADDTPPDVPTALAVSVVRTGESAVANLTWSFNETAPGNDDIQSFVIKWRKVGATPYFMDYAEKDARSLSIALPQPYADYEFQIASVDRTANYSDFSTPPVTLATAIPGPPPQTVGVTATTGLDSLQLSWTASAHDDVRYGGYYEVQVATNSGFTTGLLTYQTGNTSITISGLSPTTLYYYRVRAVDVTAQTGTYSTTGSATTDSFPVVDLSDGNPPASSPTPTVSGGIGYITAMWSPVANNDPVTYEVHLDTGSAAFAVSAATKVAEIAGTMIFIRNLPGTTTALSYGTNYYVRLIAKDVDGAAAAGTGSAAVQTLKAVIGDITLTPAQIGAPTTTEMNTAINTSASGKNKITYSTSAPVNGTNTGILGDTWYVRQAASPFQVTAVYELTTAPSTWTSRKINGATIDNLDAASITTGLLSAQRIDTASIIIGQTQVTGLSGALTTATTNAENNIKTMWGHPLNTTLIDGGDIYTNTVRASAITIADFANWVPNTNFNPSGEPVATDAAVTVLPSTDAQVPANAPAPYVLKITGRDHRPFPNMARIPAVTGEKWKITAWVAAAPGMTHTFNHYLYQSDSQTGGTYTAFAAGGTVQPTATTWTKTEWEYTVDAAQNGKFLEPFLQINTGGTPANSTWFVTNWSVRRMNGGELIIDGSVSANKMTAGTYTGGEFIIGTGGSLRTLGGEVVLTSSGITVGAGSSISPNSMTSGTLTATTALVVQGTMTLSSAGWIRSTNYSTTPGSEAGFSLSATGLDVRGGTVAAGVLSSGIITAPDIRIGTGGNLTVDSTGAIKSNNWASLTTGWRISASGIEMNDANSKIKAAAIVGDTVSGRDITVTSGGSIHSSNWNGSSQGWSLGYNGLTIYQGTIQGATVATNQLRSISTSALAPNGYTFSINGSGYAELAGANIYGNTTVGGSASHYVQSSGFVQGSATGWKISGTGDAWFNNATIGDGSNYAKIYSSGGRGRVEFFDGGSSAGYMYGYVSDIPSIPKQISVSGSMTVYGAFKVFSNPLYAADIRATDIIGNGGGASYGVISFSTSNPTLISDTNNGVDIVAGSGISIKLQNGSGDMRFNVSNGSLTVASGANIAGRLEGGASGSALAFDGPRVVAAQSGYNATTPTSANTKNFWGLSINGFGAYNNASDVREKNTIEHVDKAFATGIIKNVNIRSFKMNNVDPDRTQYGVVAQEIEEILPSAVGRVNPDDENSSRMMSYQDLWALHLAATQELMARVEQLENQLAALQ